jgi:hypothetical protein
VEVELASQDGKRVACFGYEEIKRTWYIFESRCGGYDVGDGGVVYYSSQDYCSAFAGPSTLLFSYLPQFYFRAMRSVISSEQVTTSETEKGTEYRFNVPSTFKLPGGILAQDFVCDPAGVVQAIRGSSLNDAAWYSPQTVSVTDQGLQIASADTSFDTVLSVSVKDAVAPFSKEYVESRIRAAVRETGERSYALAPIMAPSATAPIVEVPAASFAGKRGAPTSWSQRLTWVLIVIGTLCAGVGVFQVIKQRR